MCELLAQAINLCLEAGSAGNELPPSLLSNLAHIIPKPVKPGQPARDPHDPDGTRSITIGGLVAKITDLVITERFAHFLVRRGVISEAQVAFQQHVGADHHVFNLLESIKAANRDGKPAFVLFVDFSKAYPSVKLQALWRMLKILGVPRSLIKYMERVNMLRTTTLRVDGNEVGDAYTSSKGLFEGTTYRSRN